MKNGKAKCVVHFLPAKSGDCFVLEFDDKNCILIDCGYPITYTKELKPLLQDLAQDGCKISLMIITHLDEDHISGAISFIEENGNANNPQIIQVDEIWHNGVLNAIIDLKIIQQFISNEISESVLKKRMKVYGDLKEQLHGECGYISAKQSKMFETLCLKNSYKLNSRFENICIAQNQKYCINNCEITILSPKHEEIEKLRKRLNWELKIIFKDNCICNNTDELAELLELIALYQGEDAIGKILSEEISAGTIDVLKWLGTSSMAKMNEINCASIVTEIEYKGLKLLFMGDSESELWKGQLKSNYDLIKVSHHGTTKPNLAWLECTTAKKLLISTNGKKHGHPEDDFLARIIMGSFDEIYFNYSIKRKEEILSFQEKYHFKAEFEEKEIPLI